MRIDKWLWAARFYKTRTLACDEIGKGRIQVNGQVAKPSRDVKPGDSVAIRQDAIERTVMVKGVSEVRGPAPQAQMLYQETPESLQARALAAEHRRLAPEPAHSIDMGRQTKRDRRQIQQAWSSRWSASID